ncbi:hypothetical protein GCM10023324_12400 [Streptomyces youssoufiensis]
MTGRWAPPSGGDVSLLPAGRQWDMVCAPAAVGPWVTAHGRAGAMIRGDAGCAWLVPPGATAGCRRPFAELAQYVTVAATGHALIPHAGRACGPGPHWVHPPRGPRAWMSTACLLADDLLIATELLYGPLPLPEPCPVCAAAVYARTAEWAPDPAAPAGMWRAVHPACAP